MGKKIVVITGSPRVKGNTYALTESFIEAAERNGCEVVRFDAVSLQVGTCHACRTCFKNGMPCSFDDDFNEVAREVQDADGILFAFPLYFYSIPAKLKAVIDKFYCFFTTGRCKVKEWGMICCCGMPDAEVMDGVRISLQRSANIMKWHMVGELLVPGVNKPGEVRGTGAMQQAAALADAFVNQPVRR